ncbi:MAG: hypothetical protein JWP76_3797 [Dactylosporangium sp.]|jgi:hypothetical protein|nr:hypothetical protein [Dactylosporangium sp.]
MAERSSVSVMPISHSARNVRHETATDDPLAEVMNRARALIGIWEAKDLGAATVRDLCRYAAALGDVGYLERARRDATAGRPVAAPPMYLSSILSWEDGPVENDLHADGLTAAESPCTQGLPVSQVHGGQSVRLGRQLYAGQQVRAERAVTSAERKQGRSGPFVVLGLTTRFLCQDGVEFAVVDETIIVREHPLSQRVR